MLRRRRKCPIVPPGFCCFILFVRWRGFIFIQLPTLLYCMLFLLPRLPLVLMARSLELLFLMIWIGLRSGGSSLASTLLTSKAEILEDMRNAPWLLTKYGEQSAKIVGRRQGSEIILSADRVQMVADVFNIKCCFIFASIWERRWREGLANWIWIKIRFLVTLLSTEIKKIRSFKKKWLNSVFFDVHDLFAPDPTVGQSIPKQEKWGSKRWSLFDRRGSRFEWRDWFSVPQWERAVVKTRVWGWEMVRWRSIQPLSRMWEEF